VGRPAKRVGRGSRLTTCTDAAERRAPSRRLKSAFARVFDRLRKVLWGGFGGASHKAAACCGAGLRLQIDKRRTLGLPW
jgi:hypothetical protein